MRKNSGRLRLLCLNAIFAAAYAALTILLAPISYGPIQFRLSEALCVLPIFVPSTAWGLFVGCIIANFFSGNVFDVVFGSLATLLAGLCSAAVTKKTRDRGHILTACLMPVLFNSLIIGAVITCAYEGRTLTAEPQIFLFNCLYIALGELGVMLFAGLPLISLLEKLRFAEKWQNGPVGS